MSEGQSPLFGTFAHAVDRARLQTQELSNFAAEALLRPPTDTHLCTHALS